MQGAGGFGMMSSGKRIIYLAVLVACMGVVVAEYNPDQSVVVNVPHDFRLQYSDDDGFVVSSANCFWTVKNPSDSLVITNASWQANAWTGTVPAYHNFTYTPVVVGRYSAFLYCNLSSDTPSQQVLDASFIVAARDNITVVQNYLESKIVQYQSHGGGGGLSGNYTLTIPADSVKFGGWSAGDAWYIMVILLVVCLVWGVGWFVENRKRVVRQ